MKKLLLLSVLQLLIVGFAHLSAQDLTGIWRGTFYSTRMESLFGSDNKYEVQIDNSGRSCKGVTYSYQNTTFYGKASLVGMWSPDSKNLIFKEEKLLEHKMEGGDENISMFTCYLEYRKEGNKEILQGDYTNTNYITGKDGGPGGKIYLEKVVSSDFKKEGFIIKKEREETKKEENEVKKLQPSIAKRDTALSNKDRSSLKPSVKKAPEVAKKTSALPPNLARKPAPQPSVPLKPVISAAPKIKSAPSDKAEPRKDLTKIEPKPREDRKPEPVRTMDLPKIFKERKNEIVQTILTPGPDISIELYDNGEIDGDTISIFQNGRLIASKRGLSTVPITIRLKIDEDNPEQEITMVAENLGTIPPNTALMIVKSGGNRYDLRISSSESKNAVVKFKFQKE